MTYSEVRQITKKLKYKFYVDDELLDSGIDSQVSMAFKESDDIKPVAIIMLDSNNVIRELANKISNKESEVLEIMETIIIDIIHYYREDLDIKFVYECVEEIESIINDKVSTIPKSEIEACIDYLYSSVFYHDKSGDIVAFLGWSVDNEIINFMVN